MRRSLEANRVRATDPRPCQQCGKIYRSAHTLRTHMEDKHTICPGYRCVLCGTVAKSRNSLHSHMSRQHRGISTKDLPVIQMPSPFDPELASQLLARAGIKVSPADLRARASPTGPRRPEMRLEVPRVGPSSDAGSSLCGGDDPEDLTLPLSLRYGSPTPNNNSVIKVNSINASNSRNTSSSAVAVKSFKTSPENREPNTAPLHPTSSTGLQNRLAHQQSQSGTGSALLDTYLQLIAENSFNSLGLNTDPAAIVAAAHSAKLSHINSIEKLASHNIEDYPTIGRDENRVPQPPQQPTSVPTTTAAAVAVAVAAAAAAAAGIVNEERQNTSNNDRHISGVTVDEGEFSPNEDDYSDNEEPDINSKTEQ